MSTKLAALAAIAVIGFTAQGCATNPTNQEIGTVTGAVIGGVTGSVLTGGSTLGTVGGAAVGGVIGSKVGKDQDRKSN